MKTKLTLFFIFIFIAFSCLPTLAMDFIKIGSSTYKPSAPIILNTTGSNSSVSFAGTKGRNIGTVNFIFNDTAITEGAEFDVITGGSGEEGRVLINFTDQKVNNKGIVNLIASDEESSATGTVKIISLEEDGDFTFSINAQVRGILQRISNPLKGDINGKESRPNKVIRITGIISTTKP